jgi:hypothetical protein
MSANLTPAAASFLRFIIACSAGADSVRENVAPSVLTHLEKHSAVEPFCQAFAKVAAPFATGSSGHLDPSTARVLPYDAATMPDGMTWCRKYVVDVTIGCVKGSLSFLGSINNEGKLNGTGNSEGLVFKGTSTAEGFEQLQPRLIYKPHSWVTIRVQLELAGINATKMPQQDANKEATGFLEFIDAGAKAGAEGVQAHISKAMIEFLDNSGQLAGFCAQYAAQAKQAAGFLDRGTARVLPFDGTPAWSKRYVVNATQNGIRGMICFLGALDGDILTGAANGEGLAFTPGASVEQTATAETPAAAAGEKKKLTASHYLVIAPLVRSMERDGVPRCALHEVSIECEGKVDVPGLEHFRAALVPSTSIQETQIVHKFLRLSTQLIAHEDSVPAGWRRTPLVHKKGKWGVRPTFGALDALRPGRGEARNSPDPFASF